MPEPANVLWSLTFLSHDRDNCRMYYRSDKRRLYCIQDESAWGRELFKFYICSQDGEPSHEVPSPFPDLAAEWSDKYDIA